MSSGELAVSGALAWPTRKEFGRGFPSGDTVGSCARTGCASEVRPSHSHPARPKETATSSSAARRSTDERSELDVTNVSRQNSSPQILCGRNVHAHVFVDTLKPLLLLKRSQLCDFNLKRAPRFPNLSFVRLLCQANFHRRNGVTAKSIARNASNTFLVGRFVAGQFRLITRSARPTRLALRHDVSLSKFTKLLQKIDSLTAQQISSVNSWSFYFFNRNL